MRPFIKYYWGTVIRPRAAFRELLLNERGWPGYGFIAVLVSAILYTFVYIFLIYGGGQPFKPWLRIPEEVYYRYNVFFCAPSMFLGWILAAAVMEIAARLVSSMGSFEQVLTITGFSVSVAAWSTGIHDLVTSFLGAIHVIDQRHYELLLNTPTVWRTLLWIQMTIYLVWYVSLFSIGTAIVYKTKPLPSFIIGTSGFIIYQLFFLLFNR